MAKMHILVTIDGDPVIDAVSEDQPEEELDSVVRQFVYFLSGGVTDETQVSVIGQD